MTKLSFSVIIVSLNGRDRIAMPLDAMRKCTRFNGEVIVVDNGSKDGLSAFVRENYPEVNLVESPKNLGFAGGNNLGILNSTGKILVLLNDDTEPRPDWLNSLDEEFLKNPKLGIAGCKLLYPDGKTIQHLGGTISRNGLTNHLDYGLDESQQTVLEPREVDYVTGAAFAFRRSLVRDVGLLDPRFWPIYFEETDFCVRTRRKGWQIKVIPQSVVIHHESQTTVRFSYRFMFMYHRNRMRFLLKNNFGLDLLRVLREEARWLSGNAPWDHLRPLAHAYGDTVVSLPEILKTRRKDKHR